MAQQGVQLHQEQFCCSICLDLLKDPVTVPCGHSYCRTCIEGYWNQDDQRGRYSCPQCRHAFIPRPVLKRNTMLAEVVESLKKTELQAAPPDHCYAGPGDVACDFCTGRRLKAVKTCLQCLVSYCDTHIQPHYQSPAFKKHKLVKASGKLQENICTRHNKVNDLFCRTDQQCICSLCSVEEHKGHDTTSAAAERTERQKEIDTTLQNIQQSIQEREKDVKVLHQEVESIKHYADIAVEDSDAIFTELISSMDRRRSEVRQLIRDQQKCEVSRAEELRRRAEQEVTELRRRHAELEQLSLTEDHIHFIQRYTSSLSTIVESTHPVSSSDVRPLRYFEDVTVAVSKMRDRLEDILTEEGTHVSETVNREDVLLSSLSLSTASEPNTRADELEDSLTEEGTNVSETVNIVDVSLSTAPEPNTRAEFLQYSRPITLDPNTANQRLSLSKGNRKVTVMDKPQPYPDHPERFTGVWQVLSREALTGRCYWEVELSGYRARIAVSHEDNSRTGSDGECGFGSNDKSWCLGFTKKGYSFIHRGIKTDIPGRVSSRVGVYLDHSAGTLSFYSVSDDTMTVLHTVHTTFTHNLRVGLWLYSSPGDSAELCDMEQLSLTEDCSYIVASYTVSHDILRRCFEDETMAAVSSVRDKLKDSLPLEGTSVSETVTRGKKSKRKNKKVHRVQAVLSTPAEPKTRAEFLQYSRPITLDPYTAHQYLSLSKGNRKVTGMNNQSYPDHPERFIVWEQVLSREALTGRCYYEVAWGGLVVFIAVSYEDIGRAGSDGQCGFGFNDKSWSLVCSNDSCALLHRGIETDIPGCVSSRVGVYLDHSAGTLSFYSVLSDTMTLLHTVHTTFTDNLRAGFRFPFYSPQTPEEHDSAEFCDLK